ncbi:MAG TPA: arylamine N-acetyltransferase [Steroidobacteraceae bacterium]|nr:arylamine N-acetyltransferase [Steroidobacteraceae bacterium]
MDMDAYFARIGHAGARAPTLDTLAAVVLRHALAIPFENIDAFLGRRISLEPAAVEEKLVRQGRGGWCFEQNLLLGEALRALGFDVTDLAGRVVWGRSADAVAPRTHRLLLVRVEGGEWLADVGFGGQMLAGPLNLRSGEPQQDSHAQFRLSRLGSEHLVSTLVRGDWLPMYRFDEHPQLPVDFEAANFQLVHDPASHFTQQLVVSNLTAGGRHVLRGGEIAWHDPAGNSTRRELGDPGTVIATLRDVFGLRIDGETAAALAARLQAGSPGPSR